MVDEPSQFTLHTVCYFIIRQKHHPELHISLKLLYAKLTTTNHVTIEMDSEITAHPCIEILQSNTDCKVRLLSCSKNYSSVQHFNKTQLD